MDRRSSRLVAVLGLLAILVAVIVVVLVRVP